MPRVIPDPKTRVSALYSLGRTQATLDFVDVNIAGDTPVFISPRAVAMLPSEWGDRCVHLIQSFFGTVLEFIKAGDHSTAEQLLQVLREPNETHLGLSMGKSRGHALGNESAHDVWGALSNSGAAKSGLLTDLEDTALMVPGIDVDIVSDMTTNILREALIDYTQEMAVYYGIPLTDGVESGPLWDPTKKRWFTTFTRLPMTAEGKLLLVPKVIVRQALQYNADEYYRHFLLKHLQTVELNAHSALVHVLKDGRRKVTKKSLKAKYGTGKAAIVRETLKHPEVLKDYKKAKELRQYLPLSLEDIADVEVSDPPDWDALLAAVRTVKPGKVDATAYERAVEGLLSALFHPDLTNPRVQDEIHDGRKRIDITYTNMAIGGFFKWLAAHYPSASLFVECKNYGKEVANPELDQLSSRFSPSRGRVGLLVCRQFENKGLFQQRCIDTAKDDRGFIIALDDDDLAALVEARKTGPFFQMWPLLRERFRLLTD